MYERHILGKNGEKVALEYLEEQGYLILEKNFSCRQGEIDIIARDKDYIVFFEIKSRTSRKYGLPSEAVTKEKIKHILKTASYYLYKHHLENANTRVDVIEVYVRASHYKINHIKQIL